MSLFFKRGGEERASASWFGTDTTSPLSVSPEKAPRLGPFFAALRHIIDFGSTLPLDAYRKDAGVRSEMALPPLFAQQDAPGGHGLVSWLGQAFFGLALGNAVGWINGIDGFGFPTDVTWLHWTQWSYDELAKQWYVFGQPVQASQVVHVPWLSPPGRRLGLSPLECYAAVITAGMSSQEYANIRRGGGLPPVVLKNTQRELTPDVAQAAKARASAQFAKGEAFVIGADWEMTAVTIPPNHVQFIETLKMSANQIAAAYGIDPTEVGGQSQNTLDYKTEETRQIRRAADMRPYIVRLERAFARVMPAKQYVQFNLDATVRTDIQTRTAVLGAQIRDGRKSVNEARALTDEPPVPGGDYYNVPSPTNKPDASVRTEEKPHDRG